MTNKPMLSVDLLPCPHCGSSARLTTYSGAPAIFCGNGQCEAIMGGEEYMGTGEHLIESWNQRAPAAAPHQGEPVAYRWRVVGCREWTFSDCSVEFDARSNDDRFEAQALYAEQSAPVAVVMPGRMKFSSKASDYAWAHGDGWNDCLEEVARLNGVKP